MDDDFAFLLMAQHDVFTRVQARRLGVTESALRAQVAANRWQRLGDRVFVAHSGPLDETAMLWSALLRCGQGALLSHHTAAYLQGLTASAPNEVHVTVSGSRHPQARTGISIHRTRNAMIAAVGRRPPQLSVEDTALDLCDEARSAEQVVSLVVTALSRRRTTVARLQVAMARRRRLRWRVLLQDLLGDAEGIESALEWRYRRDVERAHGLPCATRQHVVNAGGRRQRRDVVYEQWRLVVELDGRLGHEGTGVFRDMRRDNAAAARGELSLRYGWSDVAGAPCRVAGQVAEVLRSRGWPGSVRRCSGCAPQRAS